MESYFTATRKTSKAGGITAAMATSKLTVSSIEDAVAEAKKIADYEIGMVELRYVAEGINCVIRTVRPSRQAVASYNEWRKTR